MPKRTPESVPVPLPVIDVIRGWGATIRAQRLKRQITIRDFAYRMNVSLNTLQRIERGEHSVQTANYLTAMSILGMLEQLCPAPSPELTQSNRKRATQSQGDKNDYF
jgi:transcriptional regulator with XRE-family HTH domain